MKIAQLSSPWIALPPIKYGGTERVVYSLSEELVKRGHDVTVFATGDSRTSAKLSYYYKSALLQDPQYKNDPLIWLHSIYDCFKKAGEFDIIHNHMQHVPMFFTDFIKTPVIHTLHGDYYPGEVSESKREVLARFKHQNFVSISNAQRVGMPELNYIQTVYNGINPEEFIFGEGKGGYMAWMGRITPKKGLETAIRIATVLNKPLKISAYIDSSEIDYFAKVIEPQITGKNIEFMGELWGPDKTEFLKNASVLLFPINWQEPFGLVMVEAMACGTPVVAYNKGSVSEIVIDGVNGFIVPDMVGIVNAIEKIGQLDRVKVRESMINKFTLQKMVDGYEEVYRKVLERKSLVI
ncbi:glycosyltransferase family 4 protein [Candidatus Gottesmanbacteria bacterium]|nr:glycosyltransferase family 4 protein [Candidatus Gottesmanbacteria bacterium]